MTPTETLNALMTLTGKEIRRFLRIWVQTLVPPVISILLYFLIFGAFIGSRIGEMGGRDYMDFIMPGLIMMSVINNAYSNVASSFYSNKFQHSIDALLVSPVPNYLLLCGFVVGGITRGLLVAAMVMAVAFWFVDVEVHNLLVIILVILATAVVFSLGGFINGLLADKFDDISIIPTFVLTPLTYLGGVFYDIDLLPDFWHQVSHLNPIVYMVGSFRYGFFGDTGSIGLGDSLFMLFGFVVLLWVICIWLLRRGVGLRT